MEIGLNDTSLGEITDSDKHDLRDDDDDGLDEPAELIVARVGFALLVSVSLVLNLLLAVAVARRRQSAHVVYWLAVAFLAPDLVFYAKLLLEVANWGQSDPDWARSDASCGAWQFASHWYPFAYSVLLLAIVYHAFITLFLDYSGTYERSCRHFMPILLLCLILPTLFVVAPSAFYGHAAIATDGGATTMGTTTTTRIVGDGASHFRRYCSLQVPPLLGGEASGRLGEETAAAYRMCYEVVLPYLAPLCFLMFPYVCLLLGLMRGLHAAGQADFPTKMSVVVTLWLVTSYLMLHVASVLRSVFGVLSLWQRLVAMLGAYEDERVPRFQTYLHVTSYALTCIWGIARPALCFKYNRKLRKALGP